VFFLQYAAGVWQRAPFLLSFPLLLYPPPFNRFSLFWLMEILTFIKFQSPTFHFALILYPQAIGATAKKHSHGITGLLLFRHQNGWHDSDSHLMCLGHWTPFHFSKQPARLHLPSSDPPLSLLAAADVVEIFSLPRCGLLSIVSVSFLAQLDLRFFLIWLHPQHLRPAYRNKAAFSVVPEYFLIEK